MRVPVVESACRRTLARGWCRIALLALCILGVPLLGAVPIQGQGQAPAKLPASAKAPVAKVAGRAGGSGGGTHEGIKVHGHWMIEVRDPEGRIISRTTFENALASTGAQILAGALFGGYGNANTLDAGSTMGELGILLGDPKTPPCAASLSKAFNSFYEYPILQFQGPYCVLAPMGPAAIYPKGCGSGGSDCSTSLGVGRDITKQQLLLSGQVIASRSGTVSQVQTIVSTCGPTVAPTVCATETSQDSPTIGVDMLMTLTAATLPAANTTATPCGGSGQISCAVNVPEAGDTINVQVTLSFQ